MACPRPTSETGSGGVLRAVLGVVIELAGRGLREVRLHRRRDEGAGLISKMRHDKYRVRILIIPATHHYLNSHSCWPLQRDTTNFS